MKRKFVYLKPATKIVFIIFAYCANNIFAQELFTEIDAGLIGVSQSSVAWGDYDNDGDLDILVAGENGIYPSSNLISKIYRNDDSLFTDIEAGLPGISWCSVTWCDYDMDGDLDILLSGSGVSKIYQNDAGVFTDIDAGLPGRNNSSAAWGDYDNDGDPDILLIGSLSSRIYRNDLDFMSNSPEEHLGRKFTEINTGLVGMDDGDVAWGDYDNDGDLDILMAGFIDHMYDTRLSRIYRNDAGTFTDTGLDLARPGLGSTDWVDFDNDGDLDILLTGIDGPDPTSIIFQNNAGSFADINTGLPGVDYSSAAWGDYDNDGDLDLLISGSIIGGKISRIYSNNSWSFTDIDAGLTGVNMSSVAWGDYDNDGDLDILLTGNEGSSNISKIYRNNSLTQNTAPLPPDGLSTETNTDSFTLSWNRSSDNETPQEGLSYNLVVGNSEYGLLVKSPMAYTSNGVRQMPAYGNAFQVTSWTLQNWVLYSFPQVIAPNYWGVQAIDNTFAGSPFTIDSIYASITFLQTSNNHIMQTEDLLSWQIQFGDDISSYQVQVDNDSTFSSLEVNDTLFVSISGTGYYSISLQDLNGNESIISGTKYYWRVKPNYNFSLPTAFTKPAPSFWFEYVSDIGDVEKSEIPKQFALYQNYPNPFNPVTTIQFTTAQTGHISLMIMDMLGREVKTLVDDYLPAGEYYIKWDATDFPSGVYFYRIRARNFTQTMKLLLLQ